MDAGGAAAGNIAIAVWANPTRTITGPGGSLPGAQVQPISISSAVSLTAVANTQVLTFTGAAGVLAITSVATTTAFSGGTAIQANLVITIDSNTLTIPLYGATNVFNVTGTGLAAAASGTGNAASDFRSFQLLIQFANTFTISVNVLSTNNTGGACTVTTLWSHG